jgi:hypothetical protein
MNRFIDKLPKSHLIKLQRSTLSKIYKQLIDSLESWTTRNILMNSSRLEYNRDITILNIDDFSHIPKEIVAVFKHYGFYHKTFLLEINDRDYEIKFVLPCLEKDISIKQANLFFNKCLKKIFLWLNIVQEHVRQGCSDSLTICLIFTNHKKEIGKHNELLTPLHVNTAFTTSCQKNTSICIYRKEEWFKVFIHETFHCLGLDFSHTANFESEDLITKAFKVQNKNGVRVYESYCEIWAEIFNTILFSFLKTKTKQDFYDLFEKQLNRELMFSLFQSTKILQYHKLTYESLILSDCKSISFKEDTHVLSYYILKTILLFYLKDFEKWCKNNNNTLLQFNTDEKNIMKFIYFIIEMSKTKQIKDIMAKYNDYLNDSKVPLEIEKTMRMSITEL